MAFSIEPTSSSITNLRRGEQKVATCDLSNFKGFPKKVTGPVTLELGKLITVMIESDRDSLEITVNKKLCEVK